MSMKKLSDQFYVGPQIEIDDIEDIQISGIKSVICLRPDGEGPGQPAFEALKTQATSLELAAHYLPIVPGQISERTNRGICGYGHKKPKSHFRLLPQRHARNRPLGFASSPIWAIRG